MVIYIYIYIYSYIYIYIHIWRYIYIYICICEVYGSNKLCDYEILCVVPHAYKSMGYRMHHVNAISFLTWAFDFHMNFHCFLKRITCLKQSYKHHLNVMQPSPKRHSDITQTSSKHDHKYMYLYIIEI